MENARRKPSRRQYQVAVFYGTRARDLVGVFAAIANDDGDAFQQAWDFIRENWLIDPAKFEYYAVATPIKRYRPRSRKARHG